jgi:hypothetical protein
MSTLQNTTQHRYRTRARLGAGALAATALIALGIAFLILPTGYRTTSPPTAGITHPAASGALTTQAPVLAPCFRDPGTHALACYHTARAPIAAAAPSRYFRDPATHRLLGKPVTRNRAGHRRRHPYSGGVAP